MRRRRPCLEQDTIRAADLHPAGCDGYDGRLMPQSPRRFSAILAAFALCLSLSLRASPSAKPQSSGAPAIFPLSDVKPGLKGVVYTILSGDQIEKIDVEVIGVLHNALGPKEDVIVVRLLGNRADFTGVAAGMSGSPVYFDGKLAGALALRFGEFTKEAIGGATPIEEMLSVENAPAASDAAHEASATGAPEAAPQRIALPRDFAQRTAAGAGQTLVPIETPLISSGLYPEALARFGKELSSWGIEAMEGGTAAASPEDKNIQPGDMVGIDLVRGDLLISEGCTVTTVDAGRILACGHPLFGFGAVKMPLSRAHVLLTLASSMGSTKIMSIGGTIGTLTQDRQTAVMGTLGDAPAMIPMDVTLETPGASGAPADKKQFHFEVIESPQLTPLLVALAAYNGIVGSPAYGEGSTLELEGDIDLKDHTPAHLENLFAPTDQLIPTGQFVAMDVQAAFSEIYSNPYELPHVDRIVLRIKALPERRWAAIDSAWLEKNEVHPGETVGVKVLLRPYRGAPFIQEIPVTIPQQAGHGTLEIVVSDADFLNRNVQSLAASSEGHLPGLEELIHLVNRERQNDCLYATLLEATPTMMVEDKEMPNVPISEIHVLGQRQNPAGARMIWQSSEGEWRVDMHQVISGQRFLAITVK